MTFSHFTVINITKIYNFNWLEVEVSLFCTANMRLVFNSMVEKLKFMKDKIFLGQCCSTSGLWFNLCQSTKFSQHYTIYIYYSWQNYYCTISNILIFLSSTSFITFLHIILLWQPFLIHILVKQQWIF